jgi:murein DD-endopeptidase MepM/ murein hydrolase activator NlpD
MRVVLTIATLLLAAVPPSAAQFRLIGLDIRVPKAPVAVPSAGRAHLVYELRVSNLGRQGYAMQRVEVSAGGTQLATYEGDSLRRIALAVGETRDGRIVGAGRQTLVYLHVAVPAGAVPDSLSHRFMLTHPDSLDGPARDTLSGFTLAVDRSVPPVLHAPLADGPWVAANGPGNTSGHRRTVIPLEGRARIPQRFATDWIKLGSDGRGWHGDSTVNANWYGYREPLLAVAAGTVVATKDGIIENVPFSPTMAVPITLETVAGNHVILDIGNGRYAFYAHLIPGSLRVQLGDRVRAGQVIGLLGNSGNSTAPHLHFHLGDAPSPLATEGIPFTVDELDWLGAVRSFIQPFTPAGAPEPRRAELPLDNDVVRFRPVSP